MKPRLYFMHAHSPLHFGTGQGAGGIELPIAREVATGVPVAPGSGTKGALRALAPAAVRKQVFGSEPEALKNDEAAGAVQFSDATLIFLPVRAVRGTHAWVTSPQLLLRLLRVAREVGFSWGSLDEEPAAERAWVTGPRLRVGDRVVLEDLAPRADERASLASLAGKVAKQVFDDPAEQRRFVERVVVVNDDVMSLLLQEALEVTTRNRIDPDTRVVAKGALWTEEALPTESILVGMLMAMPVKDVSDEVLDHVRDMVAGKTIQVGGKATVGRGLCRIKVVAP